MACGAPGPEDDGGPGSRPLGDRRDRGRQTAVRHIPGGRGPRMQAGLEQAGQAEFVIKRVYQIVGPELPLTWAADGYTESILAAKGLRMADNVHGKAPIGAEQGFCADVARNLLDAA